MANVEFHTISASKYASTQNPEEGALYFIKDNGEIRKGSQHVTGTRVFTATDSTGTTAVGSLDIKFNGTSISEQDFPTDNKPKKGDMLVVEHILKAGVPGVPAVPAQGDPEDPDYVPEVPAIPAIPPVKEYAAYIYTSNAGAQNYSSDGWQACNGNLDASKVILTENIKMAGDYAEIGNFKKDKTGTNATPMQDESGTACGTAGFSVYEIIRQMMNKSQNPTHTDPAVTLTITNNNQTVECGASVTPTYSASLSAGSYQSFQGVTQPATGITASSWAVSDETNDYTTSSGTLPAITATVGTSKKYTVTATATHGGGATPKNNLDESVPSAAIQAGTKSKSVDVKITGYRAIFKKAYSSALTDAQIMELTSSQIRSFGVLRSKPTEWAFTNAQQFLIFVPATDNTTPDAHIGVLPEGPFKKLQVSVVIDEQTGETELQDYKVNIKDAGGVNGVDYVVWVDTNTSTATDTMTISWS